jgi:hypothetical protein
MMQSVKQFLRPDWRKILGVLVFSDLAYFYEVNCLPQGMLGVCEAHGFPISYLRISSGDLVYLPQYSVLWLGLVVDLIFWYFVSSAIVFALIQLKHLR